MWKDTLVDGWHVSFANCSYEAPFLRWLTLKGSESGPEDNEGGNAPFNSASKGYCARMPWNRDSTSSPTDSLEQIT